MSDEIPVTRFELIDHRQGTPTFGRAFVTYGDMSVTISPQDGKRTIKVFLDGKYSENPPWWRVPSAGETPQ